MPLELHPKTALRSVEGEGKQVDGVLPLPPFSNLYVPSGEKTSFLSVSKI